MDILEQIIKELAKGNRTLCITTSFTGGMIEKTRLCQYTCNLSDDKKKLIITSKKEQGNLLEQIREIPISSMFNISYDSIFDMFLFSFKYNDFAYVTVSLQNSDDGKNKFDSKNIQSIIKFLMSNVDKKQLYNNVENFLYNCSYTNQKEFLRYIYDFISDENNWLNTADTSEMENALEEISNILFL